MDLGAQLLGYQHTPRTVTIRFPWDNEPTARIPTERVELAETREELARGLMNRKDLDQCRMLFNFPDRSDHSMWMRNTFVPLDMIFIDGDRVVGVVSDTVPLSEDVVSVGSPSTAVLEMPAGYAVSCGIEPGRRVEVYESKEAGAVSSAVELLSSIPVGSLVRRFFTPIMAEDVVGSALQAGKGLLQKSKLPALKAGIDKSIYDSLVSRQAKRDLDAYLASVKQAAEYPRVLIIGASGSGKTTVADKLKLKCPKAHIVHLDDIWADATKQVHGDIDPLDAPHDAAMLDKVRELRTKMLNDTKAPLIMEGMPGPKSDPVRAVSTIFRLGTSPLRSTIQALGRGRQHGASVLGTVRRFPGLWMKNRERVQRMDEVGFEPLTSEQILRRAGSLLGKTAAEFAPGIPEKGRHSDLPKITEPRSGTISLQRHLAARAGEHLDLRISTGPDSPAYSWAMKKLPKPGEGTYAPRQPDHTQIYQSFSGSIPKGTYGAGEVKVERHEPAEVVKSGPGEMRFNLYSGRVPEQFVLKQQDGGRLWTIHNTTPSRSVQKWQHLIPKDRPHLKDVKVKDIDPTRTDRVLQPKIDGAFGWAVLEGGKPTRFFSYRDAKNETGLIEHTHKMPGWWKNVAPQGLRPTVVGGEIWGSRKGKSIPSAELGGILNSRVEESRKSQSEKGVQLGFKAYHIDRLDGRRVGAQPYPDTQKALQHLSQQVPVIDPMPTAATVDEKTQLLKDVVSGRHKLTREGFVERSVATGEAIKAKLKSDYDVYIRSVYPGTENAAARGEAGGFRFSYSEHGPIVGNVGIGISRANRRDMLRNPSKWVGQIARVEAQEKLPSGALRIPVYHDLHPEKSRSPDLEM